MNQELKPRFFPLIITTLLIIQLPCHLCQDVQYEACRQPFHCGNIRNISYPFWRGNRPAFCGYPGFRLDCRANVPLLNISTRPYHVLEINTVEQTLQVARYDLWNSTCPAFLENTTLNSHNFDFSSTSHDLNITLYYGCMLDDQIQYFNPFNCTVNGTESQGVYQTEEARSNLNCSSHIYVPVSSSVAKALADPRPGHVPSLLDALASGFSVQWFANSSNCDTCLGSGGVCGYDEDAESFACYCEDRPYAFTCNNTNVSVLGLGCIIVPSIIIIQHFSDEYASTLPSKQCYRNVDKFMLNHGLLAPKRYSYTEIKKMTKSFADKLGQGGFGSVYKGILPNGRPVAVKFLAEMNTDGEEFINEVASISRTSHVNIVHLLGFFYDTSKRALVYEYLPNKSLDKFIYQNGSPNSQQLGQNKLYEIAVGVARGLEYLHKGCNASIVHFDIKPHNILLDEDYCPKIADFGLAKLCPLKQSTLSSVNGARGTVGYIAPEVFCRNFGVVSHKSDVYSYGMMVLEMAGARRIHEAETLQMTEQYYPDNIYEQGIVREVECFAEIMSEDEVETVRKMFLIGFWCIQTVPSDRPSMSKVVDMFEGSVESIRIPPKPILSSPVLSQSSPPQLSSSFESESATEERLHEG